MDQEEIRANINEPQEPQEKQDTQKPNNITLKLLSRDEHTLNSSINTKRKPDKEEEQEQPLDTFDPTDSNEPF